MKPSGKQEIVRHGIYYVHNLLNKTLCIYQDVTLIFVVTGMLQVLQQLVGKEDSRYIDHFLLFYFLFWDIISY